MLSVIIDARGDTAGLVPLLGQLTAGAVDGLVRQVLIVSDPNAPGLDLLCDETGASWAPAFDAAATAARSEWLLVTPAAFRFLDGWVGALDTALARGRPAVVRGLDAGGVFRRAPFAVLVERRRLEGRRGADLNGLRRDLGLRAARIG